MSKRSISIILTLLLIFITIPLNISYAKTGTSLVFMLEKGSYAAKEEIKGAGTVSKGDVPASGVYVTLAVEDMNGLSLFKIEQYTTDNDGKFDVKLKLPYDLENGKYMLKVKSLGEEVITEFEYSASSTDNHDKPSKPTKPKVESSERTVEEKNDKVEIKLKSNTGSFDIEQDIINSIVDNKKDLEISANVVRINLKSEIFAKYKGYPIRFKLETLSNEIGRDYTRIFPTINIELSVKIGDKFEKIKLDKKITIFVNYGDKIDLNYEKACFYRVEGNGNLVFLGGKLNKDNKTIECEVDMLGQFEVLIYDKMFKDIDIEWAKNPIEVLAARHIVSGKDNDNFKPYDNITRAEFCKMLISTMDVELSNNNSKFNDVDKTKWYYDYINSAASLGLVEGYDRMFKPDDFITREAMVVMISRAAKLEKYGQIKLSGNLNFDDSSSIAEWSKDAVLFAKENEIVKGAGNNKFEPKKNATRAEVAVIIYKMLKLKGTI